MDPDSPPRPAQVSTQVLPVVDLAGAAGEMDENEVLFRDYLRERLQWLARLRWMAIVGVFVTLHVVWGLGLIRFSVQLFGVPVLMCIYNAGFGRWAKVATETKPVRVLERAAFLQMLFDVASLAVMLHLTGGPENPFAMLFAFHIAIGAMILPLRMALSTAFAAVLLHGGAVIGEFLRILPHHRLTFTYSGKVVPDTAAHYPFLWVFGYVVGFSLMLFGIIYFVRSIASRYREAEELSKERERIAVSRQRMARIGEISSGVAHTIRNPLHGLFNCVDLLQRKPDSNGSRELLDLMNEGLRRIQSVTDRLLDFTRETCLQKVPTDMNELIRDAVRFVEMEAREKTVPVKLAPASLPQVPVDTTRFSEALLNVIHNALDACENGAEIAVTTFETREPYPGVRVEVADSGSGIPEQHLTQIFDPFFTSKPVGEGTGLGLAISRRIIEEHGGDIAIESEVGRGTKVSLLLPLA